MNEQAGARAAAPTSSASLIDRESHFSGNYRTARDLHIEGKFEGDIDCKGTVYISEGASVAARIMAGSVLVAGQLEGEVACESRFEILHTGRVAATVSTTLTVVHEGAFYQGELRMMRKGESPRTPVQPGRPATSSVPPTIRASAPQPVEREAAPAPPPAPSPRQARRSTEAAPEPAGDGDAPLSLAAPAVARVNGNGSGNGRAAGAE